LKSLLLGQFDGGRRTEVMSCERQLEPRLGGVLGGTLGYNTVVGDRLVIWRGAGTGSACGELSPQDMR
jgi:hypothetical protein